MKSKIVLLVLGVLLFCGGVAQATNIDFHSDGTIQAGDVYDTVRAWETANVAMTGGTAFVIESRNSSTFQLQGGDVAGWISVCNTSNLTISGGSVGDLQLFDSGVANLMGGTITGWFNPFSKTAIVNIYGKNLNSTPSMGGWLITGNWDDAVNSPFSMWYRPSYLAPTPGSSGSQIVFHSIPEPATLLLLGFGSLLLRKL